MARLDPTATAAPAHDLVEELRIARLLFLRGDHYCVGCVFLLTSYLLSIKFGAYCSNAQMAELVDAQVSDTCIERCGGSSPLLGTNLLICLTMFF